MYFIVKTQIILLFPDYSQILPSIHIVSLYCMSLVQNCWLEVTEFTVVTL